ncbi:glyoxylate/hydroxypyruvate reductase A-like [Uloborus diversus]|uniref:glyoxylate/hydroxypyruvate reductase A-like n=1 Tax=Uloborus diversus TaxID=327109 RepID=UPI002409BBD3|nr:glyoxylate/hydroxypyruvate reductase A-like [Uloborus diversus]
MCARKPDIYFMSKFPNLAAEIRKLLPPDVNLIVIPLSDQRIKWDKTITISDEEIKCARKAEVLVIDGNYLAKILYELPDLKWAQNTWAGVDMIFEEVDSTKPLPTFQLTRYVDPYFGELMSNYVISQIINIERGFYTYCDKQKTCEWARPFFPNFRVLSDLTVGILGAGNLGCSVGRLLKKGGCRVISLVRHARSSPCDAFDEATTDLNVLLRECDYLCNVLPSTDETRGLLDGEVLKKCEKKPVFINIGRGDIIKDTTVIRALSEGWISKAILDVFDDEPLATENPLWKTPGVHITPHVGAIPRIDGIAKFITDNYSRYVSGGQLMNVIDWKNGY